MVSITQVKHHPISDRTVILPKIELSARQSYDKIANILAQTLKADENG